MVVGLVRQRLKRGRQLEQGVKAGVHGLAQQPFGQAHCVSRVRRHPRCQFVGGVHQMLRRDHLRYQAPLFRLSGVDGVAGEHHFRCPRQPNQPRQQPGSTVARNDAELDEALSELGLFRGNPHVAHAGQIESGPDGRLVVCTDSIAFGLPEDVRNVLVTAGHTGRSAVPYLLKVRPFGFICSDGGKGREEAGVAGIYVVEADGLAGATVDAHRARMGDGISSYRDGTISAVNALAAQAGVCLGMPAAQAAALLVRRRV